MRDPGSGRGGHAVTTRKTSPAYGSPDHLQILSETRQVTNKEKVSKDRRCRCSSLSAGLSGNQKPHLASHTHPDAVEVTARWPSSGLHGPVLAASRTLCRLVFTRSQDHCWEFHRTHSGRGRDGSIQAEGPPSFNQDPLPEAPSNWAVRELGRARGSAGHILAQMMSYHRLEANVITGAQK